jgi:hypothetical protein
MNGAALISRKLRRDVTGKWRHLHAFSVIWFRVQPQNTLTRTAGEDADALSG